MRSNLWDFVVGLLFFLAMGLVGFVTIFKAQRFGETKYYKVSFPKVYGLKEGSLVRCEGKAVGEVRRLRLIKDYVEAVLEVSADVNIYAKESQIKVTPFSPLGGRVVEISRGRAGTKELETVTRVGDDYNGPMHRGDAEGELITVITQLVEKNRTKIDEIVENVRVASTRLTETRNLVGKLLNDEQFANNIDDISVNLKNATRSLDSVLGRIDEGKGVVGAITKENDPLEADVRGTAENARRLTKEFADVGEKVNKGEGVIPRLITDKKMGDDVERILNNLAEVSDTIAEKRGLIRLVTAEGDPIFDDVKGITSDVKGVTSSLNDAENGGAFAALIKDPKTGDDIKSILANLSETSEKLNDKDAGLVGALTSDDEVVTQFRTILNELGRVLKEYRDSLEDIREQAPVNAFIGTVFSAF